MPHEQAAASLVETLVCALDTMAFMVAEPVPGPAQAPADAMLVEMHYTGHAQGRVSVVASRRFAMLLAGNVLGVSPADADARDKADDCLKELLNIVVGALMPHLAESATDDFKLSIPQSRPFAAQEWPLFCGGDSTRLFAAEGQTVAARLDAA